MDAVRLMTVHGSKGLEFEAVHLPGMTKVNFPSSYRGERCPPPMGLIESTGNGSVKDELRRSHEVEEEWSVLCGCIPGADALEALFRSKAT